MTLPATVRIYLAAEPVDLRRGFDGLAAATRQGIGANPLSGYSLVQADSIDAAVEMAKGCPILASGGSVEVCQAIDM